MDIEWVNLNREIEGPYTLVVDGEPPQPVWSPPKGRYGGDLRAVFSYKMRRRFYLCYPLEFFLFVILDCDPMVKMLCERPIKVEMKIDGKLVSTTFDMWVLWLDLEEKFFEVKSQDVVDEGTRQRQLDAQEAWCKMIDRPYEPITEVRLCRQPLLENCRRLHPYLAQHPGEEWEAKVLTAISHAGPFPLSGLQGNTTLETQKLIHAAMHLVWRGELFAPLKTQPWYKLTLERFDHERPRKPLI